MWTIQHYIALVTLLSYFMLILQLLDFLPNLPLIRNIVFCWWINFLYPMKNRSLLAKKLKLFYEDINNKRTGRMRLQTDLEFKQNQVLKLNDEFNIEMFHTRLRGGKAFAAEQKIREFKKLLFRGKRLEKQQG